MHIWSKSCDSTEPWKILFVIGITCLGCKSCLSLIFGTISKGMIDGKLSVSQNTLCMPHSAIPYMDVWVFCSKVMLVASLLWLMDRVELTNHNSIRQKVWSQPGKDKEFLKKLHIVGKRPILSSKESKQWKGYSYVGWEQDNLLYFLRMWVYLYEHLSLKFLKQMYYLLQKVHVMEQSPRAWKHELGFFQMKSWQQMYCRSVPSML